MPNRTSKPNFKSGLRPRTKLMIGGAGAAMPVTLSFLVSENEALTGASDPIGWLIGFTMKTLILFAVGAFWVWLHHTEWDRMKIFELGLLAPAMILALVHSTNPSAPNADNGPEAVRSEQTNTERTTGAPMRWIVPASLVLQMSGSEFAANDDSRTKCIIGGLLGRKC